MTFNPEIHHRRSIRLKNYDYAQAGAYFVTICTHNRECLFGEIHENIMTLNHAGQMIDKWWIELHHKFSFLEPDVYTIMPNHIHGIIAIVGAALRGRPDIGQHTADNGQPHRVAPTKLGDIVEWFKTMTTNDYIRGVKLHQCRPFSGKLWHRNYYEHIIRNEEDLNNIRDYIFHNPAGWDKDEYRIESP